MDSLLKVYKGEKGRVLHFYSWFYKPCYSWVKTLFLVLFHFLVASCFCLFSSVLCLVKCLFISWLDCGDLEDLWSVFFFILLVIRCVVCFVSLGFYSYACFWWRCIRVLKLCFCLTWKLVRIYCADFAIDLVEIHGFVVGNMSRSQRSACDSCESWRSRVAC